MPQSYTAIIAMLKAKIEGIQDTNSDPIFVQVFDYGANEFTGYPVAVITDKAGEGVEIDNHRNERDYIFEIKLYQEQGQRTPQQAAQIMRSCVDAVMQSFDQDLNLTGRVARVRVVPVAFDYTASETPTNFATFVIHVVDMVNNFTPA